MADNVTLIFFRSGRGDLDLAAAALAAGGLTVHRRPSGLRDELVVAAGQGPKLRVAFVREVYVREEAAELSEGTRHAEEMRGCDVRFEIWIDDLDAVLDEMDTLIESSVALLHMPGGFLFNTWSRELFGPDMTTTEPVVVAGWPRAGALGSSQPHADIRERLDRILEAQRWGGPVGCQLDTPAYLCLGLWLSKTDLDVLRPELRLDEGYPDVGEVGRYRSVPVFPEAALPVERSTLACYEAVWFRYLPCLCVD